VLVVALVVYGIAILTLRTLRVKQPTG
jgi:hypothetical protein